MITDPTTLIALAFCIGILGLTVLILPLLLLGWSQMEPQLTGLFAGRDGGDEDEYPSQAVLPRLMKSYGTLAGQVAVTEGGSSSKTTAKRKTSARSKASATAKTAVKKTAAEKTKKPAAAKSKAKTAKPKSSAKSKPASKSGTASKTSKSKASGSKTKAKKPAARPKTPAGAKRDAVLGVIYTKKPKEVDDLKQIKGVAKVIEGKLHSAGIYTFRQIVEWDDAAIDAFAESLSLKGRIRNEGWQNQCAKFHQEKYGEKIS